MKYLLAVVMAILATLAKSFAPDQNYYTAAIFEHARQWNLTTQTPREIKKLNLDYYQEAATIAKSKDADIIIFPEYALYPFVNRSEMKNYLEHIPDPGSYNPCLEESESSDKIMLRTLSCMAREHQIFVVANVGDIQPCTNATKNCPQDGTFHFNANAVFDRNGTLVSRYWKEHLFTEWGMDLPTVAQDPVFQTDFGSFAHFICFDIIFKHIVDISERVDNVILSTMWGLSWPHFNAIHYFSGWALRNQVNYLVSNVQIPGWFTFGSGVFTSSMGPLKFTYNPDGHSKLLVTRVPLNKHQMVPFSNPDADITIVTPHGPKLYNESEVDFNTYLPKYCSKDIMGAAKDIYKDVRCFDQPLVNYTFVKLTKDEDHVEACNNGMCCSLDYSTHGLNETFYLGVVNTTHSSFDLYYWCEEACVFLRCDSVNDSVCNAMPTYSSTKFHSFSMRANFSTQYVYPSVVRTGLRLPALDEWKAVDSHNLQFGIDYLETEGSQPLLSASLYGRCYDRDPAYVQPSPP